MRNVIVVDSRDSALHESGDVILSKAEIYAEIGEILAYAEAAAAARHYGDLQVARAGGRGRGRGGPGVRGVAEKGRP